MRLPAELWVFLLSLLITQGNTICQTVELFLPKYLCLSTVFAEFAFICMVGLTNALEQDGYISGFMAFYLKMGEPHLSAAYAVMMSYWEGIVHFILFITIIHRIKSYRSLALLWVGSEYLYNCLFPGKYGSNIRPAFWRNAPLLLVPFWAGSVLLSRPREMPVVTADKIAAEQRKGLLSRPVDLILSVLLLGAMAFTVFRGLVVLECPLDACFNYIYQFEPYLKDPVGFPRVMMLMYLFYSVPLMVILIYGLTTPGCGWMLDLTIFFAGAMAQAQWCHIGASLHSRTPFTYRVPTDKWWPVISLNVLLAAVPAVLALRCLTSPAYFMKPVPKGQTNNDKKKK
uniref:EXPERA domain-containing protein n=1 Tax=Periophthalmus magnuspinnatus TaxID=409849 RepID=A0A3B4AYR9_9GOBI